MVQPSIIEAASYRIIDSHPFTVEIECGQCGEVLYYTEDEDPPECGCGVWSAWLRVKCVPSGSWSGV